MLRNLLQNNKNFKLASILAMVERHIYYFNVLCLSLFKYENPGFVIRIFLVIIINSQKLKKIGFEQTFVIFLLTMYLLTIKHLYVRILRPECVSGKFTVFKFY